MPAEHTPARATTAIPPLRRRRRGALAAVTLVTLGISMTASGLGCGGGSEPPIPGACSSDEECTTASSPCMSSAGKCFRGTCVYPYDDGADGTACDDGNPCTVGDKCSAGLCGGTAMVCDDLPTPCSSGKCVDGACTYVEEEATLCDDGDPCTTDDFCSNGTCAGIPLDCDHPPLPECLSATTLRTWSSPGTCTTACEYTSTDTTCASGCFTGACAVRAVAIASGDQHSCAVTTDGTVTCWGTGSSGELGDGKTVNSATPVPVSSLSGVVALSAGSGHTCALTGAGAVWCWGQNLFGQVGNGTASSADVPVPVPVVGLPSSIAAVAAGSWYTCALTTAGAVWCWGANDYGKLGDGSMVDSAVPVPVTGLSTGVTAISAGERDACAITAGGIVQCWGDNEAYQLGNGGGDCGDFSDVPVPVLGLAAGAAAVSAGSSHTCAITANGAVSCWGTGTFGSAGFVGGPTPVLVTPAMSGIVSLTSSDQYTCALGAAGAVSCFGRDFAGQLGDGAMNDESLPVGVVGLSAGVVAVSAGMDHACAVLATGHVMCWGANDFGELGNGGTASSSVPVGVFGL